MIGDQQAKPGLQRLWLYVVIGLTASSAASSAWAQNQPQPPPSSAAAARKPRGRPVQSFRRLSQEAGRGGQAAAPLHVADIRAFGARPDDPNFDNAAAIQRAHDSLLDQEGRSGGVNHNRGVVLVPSGRWTVYSPVWFDGDYIELHGVGSTSVISSGPMSCPPILLGKKRLENWRPQQSGGHFGKMPKVFAVDHRVDLFGRLDTAACPERGRLYGLRTRSPSSGTTDRADHFIAFWAQPPCFGAYDHWANTRKLMIQVCFESPGGPVGHGAIMGLGGKEDAGGPAPWILQAGDNLFQDSKYHFQFRTQEGGLSANGSNHIRDFSFGNLNDRGIHRIAIQLDFTTDNDDGLCNIQVYLNGKQVPVTRGHGTRLARATASEPSFTSSDHLHFIPNETGNFIWGAAGSTSHPLYGINDLNLYGLRIGIEPLYKDLGPGHPETRIDGRPHNDATRYLDPSTDKASTICYLPMTDQPHEPGRATDRLVRIHHGEAGRGAYSYAMFHANTIDEVLGNGAVSGNRLRNIRLETENDCGVALALGLAFDCGLYDCEFAGGWYGVGSTLEGGYDYVFRNNTMFGRDAAFFGLGMIIDADGLSRVAVGRTMLQLTGCSVHWSNIRIGDVNGTEAYIKITGDSSYGSQYKFDGIDIDNEGKPLPTLAAIYCERHDTPVTTLEIQNVNPGTVPNGVPMVMLVDRYATGRTGGAGMGKFYARNLFTQQVGIQTDGPGWEGVVHDVTPALAWRIHTGADGQSNVVVRQRLDRLPSYGAWQANAHIIEMRHPAPGGAQAYLCSRSGIGSWDAETEYGAGFLAFRDGTVYVARDLHKNSRPPSTHWAAVAHWDKATSYEARSYAISDGRLWIALAANTNSPPAAKNARWVPIAPVAAAQFAPIATLGAPVP